MALLRATAAPPPAASAAVTTSARGKCTTIGCQPGSIVTGDSPAFAPPGRRPRHHAMVSLRASSKREARPPATSSRRRCTSGTSIGGFPRRRRPRAEPQQIGTSDLPADATDQIGQRDSLIGSDIHRALQIATSSTAANAAPTSATCRETAHLPAVRARRFAVLQQVADHRRHQAIRVLMRAELKKNAPPRGRQALAASEIPQGATAGRSCRRHRASALSIVIRQRAQQLIAHLHPRPIVFRAAAGHHGPAAAVVAKAAQQMLARRQPAKILRAVPIQPGRRDPGEVQQMTRLHLGASMRGRRAPAADRRHAACAPRSCSGTSRPGCAGEHRVHLVARAQQRRHAPAADEAAGAGDEHALRWSSRAARRVHERVGGVARGNHAWAPKAIRWRTPDRSSDSPRLNSGACATEIM